MRSLYSINGVPALITTTWQGIGNTQQYDTSTFKGLTACVDAYQCDHFQVELIPLLTVVKTLTRVVHLSCPALAYVNLCSFNTILPTTYSPSFCCFYFLILYSALELVYIWVSEPSDSKAGSEGLHSATISSEGQDVTSM